MGITPMRAILILAFIVGQGGQARAKEFDHGAWDQILRRYVVAGRVDYAGIKARAYGELRGYVAAVGRAKLDGWTRARRIAFYLNAYNALVVKAVVDRWPRISSVNKVPGFFKAHKHLVAGQRLTLDELENRVIRPRFKDARTHFALVCAARSCPPLPSRAYQPLTLDHALDRLARRFINSRHGVHIDGSEVKVSKLFSWYAGDFRNSAGSVGRYLARYHETHAKQLALAVRLDYLPYDWALNRK